MNPFEELIRQLSFLMEVNLHPDNHQSCLISYPLDEISIQIDLDVNADKIVIGTQLGRITPGAYRDKIFTQALRSNGLASSPYGILAFSEKNDSLVLFQFFVLEKLNGEKLHAYLQGFKEHAKLWKKAVNSGDLPVIEEKITSRGSGMFGMKP